MNIALSERQMFNIDRHLRASRYKFIVPFVQFALTKKYTYKTTKLKKFTFYKIKGSELEINY